MQISNIYLTKMAILFENNNIIPPQMLYGDINELFLGIFVIFINKNVIIY